MSSAEEQNLKTKGAEESGVVAEDKAAAEGGGAASNVAEKERSEKILKAKELYSHGSRNFLVKSYVEAADELSEVCALYEELYGELSDELGMPYLLYAKSLIALALDENKVIDVPDEEDDDDDDDDEDDEEGDDASGNDGGDEMDSNEVAQSAKSETKEVSATNGPDAEPVKESTTDAADSTGVEGEATPAATSKPSDETVEESQVSSTDDGASGAATESKANGAPNGETDKAKPPPSDGEKPTTSNGEAEDNTDCAEEENEAASSLQLAWEILELAAKIFSRQGLSGLPNLAEVQTELANIEFENNILDAARDDYEKALKIYSELPANYRRAMAEIHYKIGLTYLMQQLHQEGARSLKAACELIEREIEDIKSKAELSEKDKNNIQDMEETKQEIWVKIAEIEETQAQNIAEVRAALDSYIKPISGEQEASAGTSNSPTAASSSSVISSSSKPTDISHLIKRKKPEEPSSEAEAASSPAKRPAL